MKIAPKDRHALLQAALGRIPCDLALSSVQYVNLFTGEIYPAAVYIHQGFVVHVDAASPQADPALALEIVDGENRFLIPGFVDAHIHIESSMLTPRNFARAAIPRGTTTVITDPHEIANVFGEEAVVYMHDSGFDVPMRQYINIPSCVPAVPGLECAGAVIDADAVDRLAKLPNVIGLAEVMDFIGVVEYDRRITEIIRVAEQNGLYLQGHLPVGDPRLISAYLIGGPNTCHETRVTGEAINKMRAGMRVDARESSITHNMADILAGVRDYRFHDNLCFCTDDREADDILYVGHMDEVVRQAVKNGFGGIDAVKCATLNTAREIGVENLGAVAPGYVADMLLVDDLADFRVHSVFFGGKLVAKEGKLLADIPAKSFPIETRNSINVPKLTLSDFSLKSPTAGDSVKINVLCYNTENLSVTTAQTETLPVKDGFVDISGDADLCYAMIINRYGTGGVTFGLVRRFGLREGANGSTVSHDCHNLSIVFRDAASGFAVYEALVACCGGMACAKNGRITGLLPLPVGGLMSLKPPEALAVEGDNMKKALHALGLPQKNPLLRIATMALPVIPAAKFSDLGLVDVMTRSLIPIFPGE
jgi:adenine deaminase